MDTEICAPDRWCRMPGKFVHPGAAQASTHGYVGGKQSGKLLNVLQTANNEICESYLDAHFAEPLAEKLPTEELDTSIIARPYRWIDCQLVNANSAIPGKVLHNQPIMEQCRPLTLAAPAGTYYPHWHVGPPDDTQR